MSGSIAAVQQVRQTNGLVEVVVLVVHLDSDVRISFLELRSYVIPDTNLSFAWRSHGDAKNASSEPLSPAAQPERINAVALNAATAAADLFRSMVTIIPLL
ncbi:MAG: hypothetical protein MH213_16010 [Marinobacter sp.]|nr:hypothetical protein [Marinobacter sp.]